MIEVIIAFVIFSFISIAISEALRRDPKITNAKKQEFQFPTTEVGPPLAVVFGTPELQKSPVDAWHGDVAAVPIIQKIKVPTWGGLSSKTEKQTIGYRYKAGFHFIVSHGVIDGIKQIRVADKAAWPNPDDKTEIAADGVTAITINQPNLFGGEQSEGGVVGNIDVQYGNTAQAVNAYLATKTGGEFSGALVGVHSLGATTLSIDGLTEDITVYPGDTLTVAGNGSTRFTVAAQAVASGGAIEIVVTSGLIAESPNNAAISIRFDGQISANRGLVSVILKQVEMGNSPYIKPWSFLLKRTDVLDDGTAQWYIAKADIDGDLNPAHILRECYTNQRWGKHKSTALFDDAVWQAFADDLYDEDFGISRLWQRDDESIDDLISDVLRHINAIVYPDPETGKYVPKLIRDDYDPETLETFDKDDIISVGGFAREALGNIPNIINASYWKVFDDKADSVPDHDIALIEAQGGRQIPISLNFFGITKSALMQKVAARERAAIAADPAGMTIKAKRTMLHIRPGDVFKLNWSFGNYAVTGMIVRVLTADYGTLTNNEITFKVMQDVFKMETALFGAAPSSGWESGVTDPADVTYFKLIELPFYSLLKDMGLSVASLLNAAAGYLAGAAGKPSNDSLDYGLLLRDSPTSDFNEDGRGNFTPTATLVDNLPMNAADAEVQLENVSDLELVNIGDYAVCGDEIFAVLDKDEANLTVDLGRGVLDTVPATHSAGDRIWFIESAGFVASREYTDGDEPGVKILPRTGKGELAEASATAHDASAFDSRQARPYPPGNFKINTVSYPASFTGQPTLTWSDRNRLTQNALVEHSATGITSEDGVTYVLDIYKQDGVTLARSVNPASSGYEYTEAFELADCGSSQSSLRFVLKAVRDGLDSWQAYDITVPRA